MNFAAYLRPASLDEALEALAAHPKDATIIAGGTDIVPVMRKTKYAPAPGGNGSGASEARLLVDVGGLEELKGVREEDGFLRIGGATTMGAIAVSPLLVEKATVLADAARSVGSPLVRNRATVAGNLATASPSADTAPALLALDAVMRLASTRGRREAPLADFFTGYRTTMLDSDEVITDVLVPLPSPRATGAFRKVGLRNADAISVVCVAAVLEMDRDICARARVALGAVAPVPLRARTVEAALEGRRIDALAARQCAALVHEDISPIDDARSSGRYRSAVAEAVIARIIQRLAGTEDDD